MRRFVVLALAAAAALAACGLDNISTGTSSGGAGSSGTGDAGAEAGLSGVGCGTEQDTGATLCLGTSQCPNVVVDTQALPGCGFRIRGGVADLVCACGTALCPMGVFTTCAQAADLLTSQTQQSTCVQLSEGRCIEMGGGSSGSNSTSSSGSSGSSPCDKDCLQQCGGGAGCASVCNCS